MTPGLYDYIVSSGNGVIFDSYAKAQSVISRHTAPICSVSGGADSDIVLDLIHNVDEGRKIEKYEPNLYKAAVNLFGKAYEYTARYRAFAKEMNQKLL